MTRDRLITSALALSLLAAPKLALAEDAPGMFKIPGTDTSMKIYGYAVLDAAYDIENKLGDWGTITQAIQGTNGDGTTDGYAPKKTWAMTANRSRFGFTTITPTSAGDVTFKIEGDFLPGNFRLRHGYGSMDFGGHGSLVFGKTWSTFFDLDAAPETVDFTGGIGSSNFDTPRMPQLRYAIPISKQISLAFAIEQDQTVGSNDAPFPGGVVGAFTYADGWGHVSARILAQQYSHFEKRTATTPEIKFKDTAVAWQLSGNVLFGKDNLQVAILSGKGLGSYGTGSYSGGDTPAIASTQDVGTIVNQEFRLWKTTGVTVGYAHVWSDTVRSNLVVSGLKFKRESFTVATDIEKVQNAFLNTFFTLRKNVEFGIEYAYGKATSFENALHKADGSLTDEIKESRIQMALQVNLF